MGGNMLEKAFGVPPPQDMLVLPLMMRTCWFQGVLNKTMTKCLRREQACLGFLKEYQLEIPVCRGTTK